MPDNLTRIDKAAETILDKLANGEIFQACSMSAMATPVTESWEIAEELAKTIQLSDTQQKSLLMALPPVVQKQLQATGFDDFDLIYERLLQRVAGTCATADDTNIKFSGN